MSDASQAKTLESTTADNQHLNANSANGEALSGEILPPETDKDLIEQDEALEMALAMPNTRSHAPLIFVEDGIHSGASLVLDKTIIIGSSFECDLVLTDDRIDEKHVQIEIISQKYKTDVKVTCLGEKLSINGERFLTTGQSALMDPFDTLIIGDAALNLVMPQQSVMQGFFKTSVVIPFKAMLDKVMKTLKKIDFKAITNDWRNIALSGVGVIGLLIGGIFAGSYLFQAQPKVIEMVDVPRNAFSAPPASQLANAGQALEEALVSQGIENKILIQEQNGTLYVTGSLTVAETPRWVGVQTWFDETFGGKVDMMPLVKLNVAENRRISFKAVYAGQDDPFVVSWTGERYKTGALLPEGWRIVNIDPQGVVLESRGQTLVVKP